MFYRFLADFVLIAHLAFCAYAVLGGLPALRWRRAAWPHALALGWGLLVQLANWTCPLTPLENWLRRAGGEAGYEGGFVEHHVSAVLYPERLTVGFRVSLGLLLFAVNVLVYSYVFARWRAGGLRGTSKRSEVQVR